MPKLRLVLNARERIITEDELPSIFEATDLAYAYFPGGGLFYSIVIHIVVFTGMFFLSLFRSYPDPPLIDQISYVRPRMPKVVLWLPVLDPGSQFMSFPRPKPKAPPKKSPDAAASITKGLSYPGPQLIVSDVPEPTNKIQTVLQPDLENPPILIPPLPLPNIVQVSDLTPAMPKLPDLPEPPKEAPPEEPKPPEPAMVLPALELAPPTRMETPKLVLPPSIPPVLEAKRTDKPVKMELPKQMKAAAPPPEPEPQPQPKPPETAQKTPEAPKATPAPKTTEKPKTVPAAATTAPKGKKNLLSLSPMPSSAKDPAKVPPGEARGRFVISPEPNLTASEKEPGSKSGAPSSTIAVAKQSIPSKDEAAAIKDPAVSMANGAKAANDKGASGGAGGSKSGVSGSGSPSGSGMAQGSGKRPFAGITIVGGDVEPGENSDDPPVKKARRPLQTAYGLSIISTEDSGGGLPFVGVFSNQQIYTVYLDMRQSEEEQDPNWTLEFAVIPGTAAQSNNPGSSSRNQQGLILPFPIEKVKPNLPMDFVRSHLNRMIIVYAVINTDGRMEQITIEQSPDNQLDEPVFRAMERWIFRPAQLNGEPVAAKILMGIPLWLPE